MLVVDDYVFSVYGFLAMGSKPVCPGCIQVDEIGTDKAADHMPSMQQYEGPVAVAKPNKSNLIATGVHQPMVSVNGNPFREPLWCRAT